MANGAYFGQPAISYHHNYTLLLRISATDMSEYFSSSHPVQACPVTWHPARTILLLISRTPVSLSWYQPEQRLPGRPCVFGEGDPRFGFWISIVKLWSILYLQESDKNSVRSTLPGPHSTLSWDTVASSPSLADWEALGTYLILQRGRCVCRARTEHLQLLFG